MWTEQQNAKKKKIIDTGLYKYISGNFFSVFFFLTNLDDNQWQLQVKRNKKIPRADTTTDSNLL